MWESSVRTARNGCLRFTLLCLPWSVSAELATIAQDTAMLTIHRGDQEFLSHVLRSALDPESGKLARAGSLIVVFKPEVTEEGRAQVHHGAQALALEMLHLQNAERVQISEDKVKAALAYYRDLPEVLHAEPDLLARTALMPNDLEFSAQWALSKINAPQAWDLTTGSAAARIAILDCGIFSETSSTSKAPDGLLGHPDLRNDKVISNINFTTSTNADDLCNHGTHVAGIAAGNTNNTLGIAGVGYDAKLLNVKVLGDDGTGSFSWIINGILWAAGCDSAGTCGPDRRADVINMSLGAQAPCSLSLQSAIDKAWSRGLVMVAAAGNDMVEGAISPANCNNVIGVSASDENDIVADFSNFGENVDVAAPGLNILSSDALGKYAVFSGTSVASPHVAGLAALLWTRTPFNVSNQTIVDRILNTTDKDAQAGSLHGRIDAFASVKIDESIPDIKPPAIWQTAPIADEKEILINAKITAVFDEEMDGASINGLTFTLKNASRAMNGLVTYDSPTKTALFTPDVLLMADAPYTATITTGVKDAAGNGLAVDKIWTFRTSAAALACVRPEITSHFDTNPSGAGSVKFSFTPIDGATHYEIRREGSHGSWKTIATITSTYFEGLDMPKDPKWSVHVSDGVCKPLPGPAKLFDP